MSADLGRHLALYRGWRALRFQSLSLVAEQCGSGAAAKTKRALGITSLSGAWARTPDPEPLRSKNNNAPNLSLIPILGLARAPGGTLRHPPL